jgi:hypothetical protein
VKLNIHLQLVPRSRKHGTTPPFSIRLHGVVHNQLSTGTIGSFYTFTFILSTHLGNAARGGSAVIVKDNIYHKEEVKIQAEDIQATVLNIRTKITTLLWLVCIVLRSITFSKI